MEKSVQDCTCVKANNPFRVVINSTFFQLISYNQLSTAQIRSKTSVLVVFGARYWLFSPMKISILANKCTHEKLTQPSPCYSPNPQIDLSINYFAKDYFTHNYEIPENEDCLHEVKMHSFFTGVYFVKNDLHSKHVTRWHLQPLSKKSYQELWEILTTSENDYKDSPIVCFPRF